MPMMAATIIAVRWPTAAKSRSGLLEVGLRPDPLAQVLAEPGDGLVGRRGMPAPGEPAPDAAPRVAGPVHAPGLPGVQPGLVPVIAGPPDGVGGVGVHRGRLGDPRPAGPLERVPVLQDAVTLRALAVRTEAVARRAGAGVGAPVTQGGLVPPALHGGLGADDVLADAPFARGPAQGLTGRAPEVAVDTGHEPLVGPGGVARQRMARRTLAGGVVEAPVHALVLPRRRPGPHPPRALRARGQLRAGRDS